MSSMSSWYTGRREKPLSANTLATSSMVAVSSTATMSTRGVRISSTSMSPNSMAERISSLSCWSRPPSSSAWSTMVMSSSSVMPSSSFLWKMRVSSFFHWVKRKFRGRSTVRKNFSRGRGEHGKGLGGLLSQALGEISPKIRMTTVSTTVDTVGP